jgi:hypothetical protein
MNNTAFSFQQNMECQRTKHYSTCDLCFALAAALLVSRGCSSHCHNVRVSLPGLPNVLLHNARDLGTWYGMSTVALRPTVLLLGLTNLDIDRQPANHLAIAVLRYWAHMVVGIVLRNMHQMTRSLFNPAAVLGTRLKPAHTTIHYASHKHNHTRASSG